MHGRSVEDIPAGTNHSGIGESSVGRAGKTVRQAFTPRSVRAWCQFENRATSQAAFPCCAEKIPLAIEEKIADRAVSILTREETIKNFFAPSSSAAPRQFINGTQTIGATIISGAVNIARRIKKQSTIWETAI